MTIKRKRRSVEPAPDANSVAQWRNKFLAEQATRLDAVEVAKHAEAEVERLATEVQRLQAVVQVAEQTAAHYRQENVSLSAAYISVSESMRPLQKLNEDLQAIALFMRYNYADEIAAGRHANRSLADVVTGYLARERQSARGGWLRRLFSGRRKPLGEQRHEAQD